MGRSEARRARRTAEQQHDGRRHNDALTTSSRNDMTDLYQSDLDRHLWSFPSRKERKSGKRRSRPRKLARLAASAAGMLGAAGVSYWLYRRLRNDSGSEVDPESVQGDQSDDTPTEDDG